MVQQPTEPPVIRVTKSKDEINLVRLLGRCETLINEKKLSWKLEAYVEKLEELLKVLERQNTLQPSLERLNEFQKKINYIKQAIKVEKAEPEMKLVEQTKLAHYPDQEIHLRQATKVNREVRENLFGKQKKKQQPQDVDQKLRDEDARQRELTETMVSLTQDLKRTVQSTKQLIGRDTEVLKRNITHTEDNFGNLQKESERLEKKLKFSCSCHCTMWFMLAVVCMVFLSMVMFIRINPKRY